MKKEDRSLRLQRIGEEMRRLLTELEAAYGDPPTYHVLARVFAEHFRLEPEGQQVKEASERSASSLQSPDDLEVTCREKRGQGHRGYVVNPAEACDPENLVPLIIQVPVAPKGCNGRNVGVGPASVGKEGGTCKRRWDPRRAV